jgi:hypothetical protein
MSKRFIGQGLVYVGLFILGIVDLRISLGLCLAIVGTLIIHDSV